VQKAANTKLYPEYKQVDFPAFEKEIAKFWKEKNIFQKSVDNREGAEAFVFYEGPPSANGMPGIHHVMSRTIKDLFCRYKTLQGFKVDRKAGWDTHGLPIELQVEKTLGITKDDIGKKISVEDYNAACRKDVMKFKNVWDELTEKIGYWVDLDHPYITYENNYIETVWYLLKEIYNKGYLYKGYTIQPYSPAAGTGLSSHELNQPGTYQMVKDTTVIAQFKVKHNQYSPETMQNLDNLYFLAWTTTPWTLPSNTALAVGKKVDYVVVKTFNQYTFQPIHVILAKDLLGKYFKIENSTLSFDDYAAGQKEIPWQLIASYKGSDLVGMVYEQLLPYTLPAENPEKAFQVIAGDFVTTEDGTGIVHIAPTFGADDARVAKQAGVPPMLILNEEGKLVPLVDLQGKFVSQMGEFAGKYVKNEYYTEAPDKSVDVELAIKLKEENKAFKVEKYEHSYPHCWRTDKPILYYPLESWFIKTTAVKDRLIALNKTINWKPEHTGEGRFGNWLENLVDWNLSRSRFWGTPLPIWRTEDGSEEICIGSIDELKQEAKKSVDAGLMNASTYEGIETLDLHRPFVDNIVLSFCFRKTNEP
jgi:isoleucyl-tRNA synthetase